MGLGRLAKWWSRTPVQDEMVALLKAQHAAAERTQAEVIGAFVKVAEASVAQANVFGEYLRMIAASGTPQVRVMTDADEALQQTLRDLKAKPRREAAFREVVGMAPPEELGGIVKDLMGAL